MAKSKNDPLRISYDKEADVLYVSIIDFEKRFGGKGKPISIDLLAQFELAR